jgi:DNA transformation protein
MRGSFGDLLEELFAPLGGVAIRRMFGGLGVFKEGMMFALVADDVLFMKADEATQPAFEAEGCGQFVYDGMRGRTVTMPYWRLPDRLYDEPDQFRRWAVAAFEVALRTQKKPAAKRKEKPKGASRKSDVGRPRKPKLASRTKRRTRR